MDGTQKVVVVLRYLANGGKLPSSSGPVKEPPIVMSDDGFIGVQVKIPKNKCMLLDWSINDFIGWIYDLPEADIVAMAATNAMIGISKHKRLQDEKRQGKHNSVR